MPETSIAFTPVRPKRNEDGMQQSRKHIEEEDAQDPRENLDGLITLFVLLGGIAVCLAVMFLSAHSS